MKVSTVHGKDLTWAQTEGAEDQTASAAGYELSVQPGEDKTWLWSVQTAHEQPSEAPVVVQTGTAKSENGAKNAAREGLNRANRERAKAQKPEPKPQSKVTVRQQTPEPKTDLVKKTKAQVAKNLAQAKKPRKTSGEMLDEVEGELAQRLAA